MNYALLGGTDYIEVVEAGQANAGGTIIISLQNKEGKWGYFHTLYCDSTSPVTTKKALRRLEILGNIELICEYESAKEQLQFIVDWLKSNMDSNGIWEKIQRMNYFSVIR